MKQEWTIKGICKVCSSDIYRQVGDFFGYPPEICSHQRIDVQFQHWPITKKEWEEFLSEIGHHQKSS